MFRNLETEQAKNSHTDEYVAQKIGLSRKSYEAQKRNGNIKVKEILGLLRLYNASFEYLFETEDEVIKGVVA
ncbi:MAG: hypothetical protein LBI42_00360 [Chitinispirillales bacterium]|jgi:DNA-binding XRE family transcriptional regulator|nr:hypothetical protein [Chitinispirillales bacterium]